MRPIPLQYLRNLSLRQQMMALLGGFILATSLLAGATHYQLQKQDLARHQHNDIQTILNRAADLLTAPVTALHSDLTLLASLRSTQVLAAGKCAAPEIVPLEDNHCPAIENLSQAFEALLQARPDYLQVSLVGLADHGREILRVDHFPDGIRRASGEELQALGEHAELRETMSSPAGQMALQPIQRQASQTVLHATLPLLDPQGQPFGLISIRLAYDPVLAEVGALVSGDSALYVTTRDGEILLGGSAFPGTAERPATSERIQERQPKIGAWLRRSSPAYSSTDPGPTGARRVSLNAGQPDQDLAVVVSHPAGGIVDALSKALSLSALLTLLLLVGGIFLTGLLSRGFTRDLMQLANVARRLTEGDISPAIPRTGNREIRLLGEAFASMRESVMEQDASLREQGEFLRTIIETSTEGIITTDERGIMQTVNPAAARMFGYHPNEMLGQDVSLLMPSTYASQHHRFMAGFTARHGDRPLIGRTVMGVRKNGSSFPIGIGLASFDLKGLRRFAAFIQDISELQAAEDAIRQAREIESLAYYDPLTNLPNRRLLRERLGRQLTQAATQRQRLAVALIDLDGFKEVNDRMGHEAGDQLLKAIASRLTANLRGSDIVSRMGGDEFALVLANVRSHVHTQDDLQRPMGALIRSVAEPVTIDNEIVRVSASIGISLFPDDGADIDTLLRKADIAMYQAKSLGRNRYLFFSREMEESLIQRHELLTQLERAIERDELELHYQPQVDMVSGEIPGAEALIRWNSPTHGLRMPGEFIPLAEESGLIVRLGRWIINAALRQLEEWNRSGLRLKLGINVAVRQFQDPHFVDELGTLLRQHGDVDPGQIVLEITETAAMADLQRARDTILSCQAMGISFSLDDFGTGFSSLLYLQQLPVQSLKIDRGFVRNILEDANDAAIAKGIIDMAHLLNLPVVAEGVEDASLANRLLEFGCRFGQGYGIARPMPAKALPEWIQAWQRPAGWRQDISAAQENRHFGLVFARQAHEKWLGHLLGWIESPPLPGATLPQSVAFDPSQCSFGRWYIGPGLARYGQHAAFARLHDVHHDVHHTASAMLEHMQNGRLDDARALIPELLNHRDELFALLDELRQQTD